MNEGDFVLNSIAAQGREANETFERRLKASTPPLEILLECPDDADELAKCMAAMERQFAPNAGNPFGDAGLFDISKAATDERPALSIAELEAKYPENPWGAAVAKREPVTQPEQEETEAPQLPEQRGTVRERHLERMKSAILARMQDGVSRATAVAELLKIAGSNTYSRQIVREAELQSEDA